MTTQLDDIDRRLAQLVEAAREQGENITRLGREQRESFTQLNQEQRESFTQLNQEQRERFEQEMVALRELRQITERQAETSNQQTENVRNLYSSSGNPSTFS